MRFLGTCLASNSHKAASFFPRTGDQTDNVSPAIHPGASLVFSAEAQSGSPSPFQTRDQPSLTMRWACTARVKLAERLVDQRRHICNVLFETIREAYGLAMKALSW
jgi:hypothetical protein